MKTVSGVVAVPNLLGGRIDLSWKNPAIDAFAPASFIGVRLLRSERTFPLGAGDGDLVYTGLLADGTLASTFSDVGLAPLKTYYYTVFAVESTALQYADDGSRASAFCTTSYGLAERLYRMLPAAHQRLDRPLRDDEIAQLDPLVQAALKALPPALRSRGQLRRFFDAGMAPLDLLRSFAEGLPQLHDVDLARPEFLVALAQWVGWSLDRTLAVFQQRNEIKFAPRLYRTVGTLPNLRAIVNRYTGWYTQIAEFDERITRANLAPQLNVYAAVPDGTIWRGAGDAAPALGFAAGHDEAVGGGGPPATSASITSLLVQPFALRPGMELSITADGRPPMQVRFRPGDFADITQATAKEVVAVLSRTLPEVRTELSGGGTTITVSSYATGPDSSIRIDRFAASLVTLEGAPRGRLACFADAASGPRRRLFYEAADPLAENTQRAAVLAFAGSAATDPSSEDNGKKPSTVSLPSVSQGRIRYKTFRNGEWGASLPLPSPIGPATDPAAALMADGRVFVAWVESPATGLSRIRFTIGTPRAPSGARLVGRRNGVFPVRAGMTLVLHGNWVNARGFEFVPGDFAIAGAATGLEVIAALNARLGSTLTASLSGGAIVLVTVNKGSEESLSIDLRASSAAAALGFEQGNSEASGDWGDLIDWDPAADIGATVPPGTDAAPRYYADLHTVLDRFGRIRLFWAAQVGGEWSIFSARRTGVTWGPTTILASNHGGNREPFAETDALGRIWLFWSHRETGGAATDTWTLHRRRLTIANPFVETWSVESAIPLLPAAPAADRQPSARRLGVGDPDGSGNLKVFFRSNRGGSVDLWSFVFNPLTDLRVGLPAAVFTGAAADHAPMPITGLTGATELLFRSDRGIGLSRVATRELAPIENRSTFPAESPTEQRPARSFRSLDTGTMRSSSGTTTVVPDDVPRLDARRRWDDYHSYTPQRPDQAPVGVPPEEVLKDDDLYTRGTVGLFLSPIISTNLLTPQMIERLKTVLQSFLPINVRAVVVLAPRIDSELVYPLGKDIGEKYEDKFPYIEYYTGLADSTKVVLPDWVVLHSNTLGHISADTNNLNSLHYRVFFEPPT